MDCDDARTSISARVDGELPSALDDVLDHHLAGCPACRGWENRAFALRRSLLMRHDPHPPDLADRVLASLSVPHAGTGEWVRYGLGVVAATIAALHLPLLLGLGAGADHDARHIGTFGVALGVGLLWAALRPERAIGLIPLAAALAAATLVGAAVDVGASRATVAAESTHLLELVGLALLWYLSGGMARLRGRTQTLRPGHRPRAV
ncbi:MAG: zf-HC2 domain-containing protein [Acidimicrobiales bacterium]